MAEYLNKIVQENSNDSFYMNFLLTSFMYVVLAEGHDSMEDAMSCMELMLWKVKEDLKNSASHH